MDNTKERENIVVKKVRGLTYAFIDGKMSMITFETKKIRSFFERELNDLLEGCTYFLPEGYHFEVMNRGNLERALVAKICNNKPAQESEIDKMAIDYLRSKYKEGYVDKRITSGKYPIDWDITIRDFKEGAKATLASLKILFK